MSHHEMCHDTEATLNEEDIGDYCKQFLDSTQAQLHRRYDLRSSKNRSRELKQQEEIVPQDILPVLNKGKGNLNPDSSEVKVCLNKECNSSEEHTKEKAPILIKTINDKEREVDLGGVEKG